VITTDAGYPRAPLSGPELKDLRERATTCSSFAAIWSNTTALTGEGDPEQLRIGLVTADFFQVLGAEPALGRTFRPADAAPGAHPTILLAWSVFQRRYAADPSLVGRDILVNDRPATVIGVRPRAFRLLLPPDSAVPDDLQAWQPFGANLERGPRGQHFLRVIGRMHPGVTVAQARDDITAVARRISREFAEYGAAGRIFNTVPLHDDGVREIRPALLALFAGVGILLLIACVNVASLLIARAAARRHETALRLALGASRSRLVRLFLIEGVFLALLGGGAGLATGYGVLRGLVAFRPDALSRIDLSRFDLPVLAFTFATALLWGFLFSLAPLVEVFDLPNWGGGYVSETAVDRTNAPNADYRTVTPELFDTLGVRRSGGAVATAVDWRRTARAQLPETARPGPRVCAGPRPDLQPRPQRGGPHASRDGGRREGRTPACRRDSRRRLRELFRDHDFQSVRRRSPLFDSRPSDSFG
jgi:predicted permease